jgi:hypothetical protein
MGGTRGRANMTPTPGPSASPPEAATALVETGPVTTPDAAPGAGIGVRRLRGAATAVLSLSWVPLVASALALVLSLASIYISTRDPEVVAILPDIVRLVGGRESGSSYVYLQPAFVSTGVNDRVEVIADMTLLVERADGTDATTMAWQEQASLATGEDGLLSYRYAADAVPLLVGPRSAAMPLALFQAPRGWYFREGPYRFTLQADRVVASSPLRASFEVTLDADAMAVLDAAGPERFLAFDIADEG